MKKLFSFVAAALCAAAFTLSAGAYVDLTKCRAEWDWETDNINYIDIETGKLVAIEYPNGRIVEVEEPYESEEPYEPAETWEEESEEPYYWEPEEPSLSLYSYEGQVFGSVYLDSTWNANGAVVERRKSGSSEWEQVCELGNDFYSTFTDSNLTCGATYTYRYRAYKETLGVREYVCETQQDVFVEFGDSMPYLDSKRIGFDTVKLTAFIGEKWGAGSAVLSRYDPMWDTWKKVGISSEFVEPLFSWGDEGFCVTISDTGLSAETDYLYRFEFFAGKDGTGEVLCSFESSIHTDSKPADPIMLTPEAHSDSITFTAKIDERWCADGFLVQKYNFTKKKWYNVKLEDKSLRYYDWDENDHEIFSATYTAEGLKSATKYRYRIRFYKLDGEKKNVINSVDSTVYTLLKAPTLQLGASAKKAKLSWNKVSGAQGYEIYVTTVKPGDYSGSYDWYFYRGYGDDSAGDSLSYYNQSYESNTLYPMSVDQFKKKTTVKDGKTSYSYTIKSNLIYVYRVRAYKKISGTKVYSDFSNQVTTDSTSALLNGITLKSQVTVNDYDLGLIKAALKKCVNSKMTNAQKAAAVYDYVHNIATYEYDYNKIPSDSIEAILVAHRGQCYQYAVTYQAMMKYLGFDVKLVSGKTSSGGPHWWCQLNCRGTDYMIDPQVGGRFLIRYDQMGYFAVTKEKVYD